MKQILTPLLQAATVTLLTTACQADLPIEADDLLIPDPTAPIELSGSAPLGITAGPAMTRADNDDLPFTLYAVPNGSSVWAPYINGESATLTSGEDTRGITTSVTQYWPIGGQELKFIGLMRADKSAITMDANGRFSLTCGQGEDKDILVSQASVGSKSNPQVKMVFNRFMARLILKPGKKLELDMSCRISTGTLKATYDVIQNKFPTYSGTNYINYSTTQGEQTYYFIPSQMDISQLTNVVIGGLSRGDIPLKDSNGNAAPFRAHRGNSYTIELSVEGPKIVSTISFENPWTDGGSL